MESSNVSGEKTKDEKRLNAIAKRILELRQSKLIDGKYLSQNAVANEIGITQKQYWRLENGEEFKVSTLFKLLDYYKLSFEEFFKGIN